MAQQIPTVTIDDLRAFYAKHFPHAPTPENFLHDVTAESEEEYYEEEEDLGFYRDGKRRTLTDEQIAIFRHSEIQEILQKRRHLRLARDGSEDGEVSSDSNAASPASVSRNHVQSGRVEKTHTPQWAKSSARTRAANKRHRTKYQKKKKEKAKEEARLLQEREKERGEREKRAMEGGEDSDEWSPWNQANGPDVSKEETVELDY